MWCELGVAPLSAADTKLDTSRIAERVAQGFRSSGTKVTKMSATLDGKEAVRLKLDGGRLPIQDFIMVNHDGYICTVLITHKQQRDELFIAAALKGFRLR